MRLSCANPDLQWATKALSCAALLTCALLAAPAALNAQAPDTSTHKTAAAAGTNHSTAKHHRARRPSKPKQEEQPVATPAVPPPPPKPNWPVNDPPAAAKVSWDSQGLQIKAANSSLSEILAEVAADTGVKVQGISHDQRVFGDYGPAPARQVLSDLLHGTDYNFLMLGDVGNGTPKEVILSARGAAGPHSNAPNQPSEPYDPGGDQEQQPAPVFLNRPPMGQPGNQPNAQQRWQEMQRQQELQRQRQMEQQQPEQQPQDQQPEPPVNPPPQ